MRKKAENKYFAIIAKIVSYIFAIGVCLATALVMNAQVGWTFFYVLVLLPIASLVIIFSIRKFSFIRVETSIDKTVANKGDEVNLSVKIYNRSLVYLPNVRFRLIENYGLLCLSSENREYCVSCGAKSCTEISVKYKACSWGKNYVGFEDFRILGFLSILSFNFPEINDDKSMISEVKVYPNIPDVALDNEFVKVARSVTADFEGEDSSDNAFSFSSSGVLGYDYRKYEYGDSLKRINHKLSSKVGELMVRLDETLEGNNLTFLLDKLFGSYKSNEIAVEGLLAICYSFVRLGFVVNVILKLSDDFELFSVENYSDVVFLQNIFLDYEFVKDYNLKIPQPFPFEIQNNSLFYISPRSFVEKISENNFDVYYIFSDEFLGKFSGECYRIYPDFQIKSVL